MANRLARSMSPYLQQHQDNPVDWFEWGQEAFDEARRRDVPILLSVGYAACHWCHVMAHESFEDSQTADLMNAHFVNVKVDREERPDVDAVYMQATQAMTGHGGWPMTVFLDLERRPFYAGTYFPPTPRHGLPSFTQILVAIAQAWGERRSEVEESADRIAGSVFQDVASALRDRGVTSEAPSEGELASAENALWSQFDGARGGFGGAPKFPPSTALEFLLRHWARTGRERTIDMVNRTCESMARGGLYDQIGGGFARYSVDNEWVVPHFEKMLYDNALLLRIYAHWWRATRSVLAQRVVRETAEFIIRELRTDEGGFASALDADSQHPDTGRHEEGAFYVWTRQQLVDLLDEGVGVRAADLLGVTEAGTFEHGTSTLQLLKDPATPEDRDAYDEARLRLLDARDLRPRPARDDKVVASWNGLAIAALAEAGALFDVPEWVIAARDCAELLRRVHRQGNGRYVRTSRAGVANHSAQGVLDDHANVAEGFLALFQATGESVWLEEAGAVLEVVLEQFGDGDGGFYDTAHDAPVVTVGARPRDPGDGPTPSGWAAAAGALLTHSALTGSHRHRAACTAALGVFTAIGPTQPRWAGWGLAVAEALLDGPREVAIVGASGDPRTLALHRTALRSCAPGLVVAVGDPDLTEHPAAVLHHRALVEGQPAAYVCRNFTCDRPVISPADLMSLLSTSHAI
jgi:uncharacterized protein